MAIPNFKPSGCMVIVKPSKTKASLPAFSTKASYLSQPTSGAEPCNERRTRKAQTGVIIGVGKDMAGQGYKKDDKVLFLEGCGTEFEVNGATYLQIYSYDLMGTM